MVDPVVLAEDEAAGEGSLPFGHPPPQRHLSPLPDAIDPPLEAAATPGALVDSVGPQEHRDALAAQIGGPPLLGPLEHTLDANLRADRQVGDRLGRHDQHRPTRRVDPDVHLVAGAAWDAGHEPVDADLPAGARPERSIVDRVQPGPAHEKPAHGADEPNHDQPDELRGSRIPRP